MKIKNKNKNISSLIKNKFKTLLIFLILLIILSNYICNCNSLKEKKTSLINKPQNKKKAKKSSLKNFGIIERKNLLKLIQQNNLKYLRVKPEVNKFI